MPVLTPGKQRRLGIINADTTEPVGERTRFFWETERGIPRRDDLGVVRQLEKTHPVALPLNTIKTQISTTPFSIVPTIEDATDDHRDAAEEIEDWLRGNYNGNNAPFDHLTKQWAHDIISIDTGVIEKVPTSEGFLSELYPRDGAVFTKALDKHDRLPEAPEAAYWQFQFSGAMKPFDPTKSLHDLAEEFSAYPYRQRQGEPIGFSREQLIWTETNPAPWRHYGFGKVQQAKRIAEIVLNQDSSNLSYFKKNEVPDGLVNIVEANQDEIEDFRQYWKDNVRGREHVLPIVGGNGSKIEWTPFRPTPDELEFMASQKWYNQLIWMVFGLNQGEVGDIENINRATMEKQAENVFRTTTKPLLDRLANDINNQILPFKQAYHRVGGEIEFQWQIDNPAMEAKARERQRNALEEGTATINEVRTERGEEPLEWGDMPLELVRSVARNHPEWALEQWADVENPPEPAAPGGMLAAYGGSSASQGGSEEGKANAGESPTNELLPSPSKQEPGSHTIPLDAVGKNPHLPEEYRELLTRESMRDEEWDWQFAPVVGHAEQTEQSVSGVIKSFEEEFEEVVENEFPEEPSDGFGHRPNFDPELDDISREMANALAETIIPANSEAMNIAAEYHADNLEEEAEKAFSRKQDEEEVAIEIEFNVEDTLAHEQMESEAASRMVTVGETVKESIRNTLLNVAEDGGNVTDATRELRDKIDALSDSHARLVARTETLMASRSGSQALAESSDLIGGKEWNATDDSRTRAWHAVMDGVIVAKDDVFTVPRVNDEEQPSDYPRQTKVVGDDQPFNCRCDQRPVLNEDMPEDIGGLQELDGVSVYVIPKDSDRMREVVKEHGRDEDGSLSDVLRSALERSGSRNKACSELGISTATLYRWGEIAGMSEFGK